MTCVEYQLCGNHLCYPVKIRKIIVQVDADGTDDHVYLDICSDSDNEGLSCCSTGVLESTLANDWSSGDREEWGANFLGDCMGKEFRVSQGFQIKMSKDGDDSLAVNDVIIQVGREECGSFLLWNVGCDIVERENFKCGRFDLGNTGVGEDARIRSRQTNKCKIEEYTHEEVKLLEIYVGEDGSDDDIHLQICSDVDNTCCDTLLNSWENDFKRNHLEEWGPNDIGKCSKERMYKIQK